MPRNEQDLKQLTTFMYGMVLYEALMAMWPRREQQGHFPVTSAGQVWEGKHTGYQGKVSV